MSTKQVRVTSINPQVFMLEVVKLVKAGADFAPKNTFLKAPLLTAIFDIDESVEVEENSNVKVLQTTKTAAKKSAAKKEYTREEMTELSLKQVRDIVEPFGIKGRDKLVMIDEYFAALDKDKEKTPENNEE